MASPTIKISLTQKELITITGIIGGLYGQTFNKLYDELTLHLNTHDTMVADEISILLAQMVHIDEDKLLYDALIEVDGAVAE